MNEHAKQIDAVDGFVGVGDAGALEALHGIVDMPREPRALPVSAGELSLLQAYRDRGYLRARLDPLELAERLVVPELDPRRHGVVGHHAAALIERLESVYCGPIGWDFAHVHDTARRRWLEVQAEEAVPETAAADALRMVDLLTRAYAFEEGLAQRIPGGKLFGCGGAETFLLLLETLLAQSARLSTDEVVVGGMHRGRFNMLANTMMKPLGTLIAEILGKPSVPDGLNVSSDVSYHLGYSGEREIAGRRLRISVSPHPSHLQLVPIIAQGRARAKQAQRGSDGRRAVLPLLLHTDASFAGQGLVAEMMQLSRLAPFDLGGTIHVVINNQIGFTTGPEEARSARFPTDIAKLIEAPVLHVNGDDPEAVARAGLVAATYRARFASDIIVDLWCYRRAGHNEIDEPRFTQPVMYRAIDARAPVHEIYVEWLARRGLDARATADAASAAMIESLKAAFESAKAYKANRADGFDGLWAGLGAASIADMLAPCPTGIAPETLRHLGRVITTPPHDFELDTKVQRFLDERARSVDAGDGITWATAEALALASLVDEGTPVRFGGQDAVRGAFTQRHLEVHDQRSGARHMMLAPVARSGAAAEIHNTPLIEHAVLCYEYGISLADPHRLVIWEAQFGEFLNIAQPVFDQCIACGEDRWLRASGLVILLPHGIDGGGPDHSTGRPERLLAACAGANIQVVNASTPANYFHVLRRQMKRPFRKPLVVLAPKALLRHKGCVSSIQDMATGQGFRAVIAEDAPRRARRVILSTGKICYDLAAARTERGLDDQVALIRVEQLYPLPEAEIRTALARHIDADLVWCEEEPANMGFFHRLDRRLETIAGRAVRRIGRPAAATPAVGVKYWEQAQMKAVIDAAFDLTA